MMLLCQMVKEQPRDQQIYFVKNYDSQGIYTLEIPDDATKC